MQTLVFNISIQATPEKIWKILWNPETYPKWTAPFMPGSHFKGTLEEGQRVKFLSPEQDGMVSLVDKLTPNEFVAFQHVGILKKGVEQPNDDEARKWVGAIESYRLTPQGGHTNLEVWVDTDEDYIDFMKEKFTASLDIVKQLSESQE
jgi:hypothetical protein